MSRVKRSRQGAAALGMTAALMLAVAASLTGRAVAQPDGPTVLDSRLEVKTVTTGLVTPITIAFVGPNDFLVLEKNTGKVKRIVDGAVQSTVLDLAVNFGSERGLLGIALHPRFPRNPGV